MSIQIQIQEQKLLSIFANGVQEKLVSACPGSIPPFFFDHADVSTAKPPTISYHDNVAEIHLFVDFFLMNERSLQANVNKTPPEVLTPSGQADLVLELGLNGTNLVVRTTGVHVDPRFEAVAQPIRDGLQTELEADLGKLFTEIGIGIPQTHTISKDGNTLLIAFNPSPGRPITNRLRPGQDWNLFIDKGLLLTMSMNKLSGIYETLARQHVQLSPADVRWTPRGNVPHIHTNIGFTKSIKIGLISITATGSLNIDIDFSLAKNPLPKKSGEAVFQQVVKWDLVNFEVEAAGFIPIPSFLIESARNDILEKVNAPQGSTTIGTREYMFQRTLPALSLGTATFTYRNVTADANGMDMTGTISDRSTVSKNRLEYSVTSFADQFTRYVYCNYGTRRIHNFQGESVTASIDLWDAGKLCGMDIVSPGPTAYDVRSFIFTEEFKISLVLPPMAANVVNGFNRPVMIRLRTSRGVRLCNLGLPPAAEFDSNGNVKNSRIRLMNDCNGVRQVDPWTLHFGPVWNPHWTVDPSPVWVDQISRVAAFQTSLITLNGVRPGDVISLKQPMDGGVSTFATAVVGAPITIPAMFAVRSYDEGMSLENLNRSSLGVINVSSRLFQRTALLKTPGAVSHRISSDSASGARIITTYGKHEEETLISDSGIMSSHRTSIDTDTDYENISGRSEDSKTPSSCCDEQTNPASAGEAKPVSHPSIPGCKTIHPIPGFESSTDLAIAEMEDGTYRAARTDTDGKIRITGTIARWPRNPLSVAGKWAIASYSSKNEVAIFSITEGKWEFDSTVNGGGKKGACCADCAKKHEKASQVDGIAR